MSSCAGEPLTADQSSTVEQLESRLAELELQLESALAASREPTPIQPEVSTSVPQQSETTGLAEVPVANNVQFSPSAMKEEFWNTVGANSDANSVWFGLSDNSFMAVDASIRQDAPSEVALWQFDAGWEMVPNFEAPNLGGWDEWVSVRFFDATGNGVEDIVMTYHGGRRVMGNVFAKLDGEWVDTGTHMRPEFAMPGKMSATWLDYSTESPLAQDKTWWLYWDDSEWKACEIEDPDGSHGCNYYWTGG